jgi:hypothetical protein
VNPKSCDPPSDTDRSSCRSAARPSRYRVSRSSRPVAASITATAGSHHMGANDSDTPAAGPSPVAAITR